MGEWGNGKMGEWGNGKMGEWENGRMGEWEEFNISSDFLTSYFLLNQG